jgi:hypothetical protein
VKTEETLENNERIPVAPKSVAEEDIQMEYSYH